MKRILLDTNIVLDVLLIRQPFVDESKKIWQMADEGLFDGCLAAHTIPTIYYVCEKQRNRDIAIRAIDVCVRAFEIVALYRECVLAAQRMSGVDFEDNLQIACAITDFIQGIVTRDPRGYLLSPIPVYTPGQLLHELGA